MSHVVIRAERVSKRYVLGREQERATNLAEAVSRSIAAPFRRRRKEALQEADLWALRDVSFEVEQGDVVGVVGRNGAGKSTLLKILSQITDPTSGQVEMRGRVASLLEVGTGFHPELTGRENIYLNGAILGMSRREIQSKFDEIVEFADISRFLDTPVKRYSSGMYTRLAFSVAAHLEPEILLVDEVLAVGDAAFQKKCLGKMGAVAREGRTVLFVSHNLQAVSTLTKRSILISHGHCVLQGATDQVIAEYLREGAPEGTVYIGKAAPDEPRITRIEVRTTEPGNVQLNGHAMEVLFEITTPVPVNGASLSFQACDALQRPIAHLWTFDSERPMCRKPGRYHVICRIPELRLYMGHYTLTAHLAEGPGGRKFETIEGLCPFEVVMYGKERERQWNPGACTYLEDSNWAIQRMDPCRELCEAAIGDALPQELCS